MYNNKYIKTKMKIYIQTIEYIQTSSVIKYQKIMNIACVHKIFLEEFRRKQICDERKIVIKINEDLELSESDDESDEKIIRTYFSKKIWI